jgi:CRISPR-associated protein Cmr4
MSEQRTLLLQTLTSLHAGAGQPRGALRNPLLRENETRWPVVSASTVKGAMRKQIRDAMHAEYQSSPDWKSAANQDPRLLSIFGLKEASEPCVLAFGPARLFAFPLRSAHGIWALVTCPSALNQFALSQNLVLSELPQPEKTQAFCAEGSAFLLDKKVLILEDIELSFQGAWSESCQALIEQFPAESEIRSTLQDRLVLVSDTCFNLLVQSKTELFDFHSTAGQDNRPQPVEFLPAETLLYTQISAEKPDPPFDIFMSHCPEYVSLGAYQTLGKGLCAVIPLVQKGEQSHV